MKLKLDNEQMLDQFFEEARILGIVAPIADYRFCWQINQILNFDFRFNTEIDLHLIKRNRKYFFPVYKHSVNARALNHFIYNNQNDGEYLLPEFRHLDYLWLTQDEYVCDAEFNDLTQAVKSLPIVQMVIEISHDKIKNKQHLLF